MYRYVISFWDDDENMVGLDLKLVDVFVDALQPNRLEIEVPTSATNALISCQVEETQEIVFLAGYSVEVIHG